MRLLVVCFCRSLSILIERFRFEDGGDYGYEIFSIGSFSIDNGYGSENVTFKMN